MSSKKSNFIVFGSENKPNKVAIENRIGEMRVITIHELQNDNQYEFGDNNIDKENVTATYNIELMFASKKSLSSFIDFLQEVETNWKEWNII